MKKCSFGVLVFSGLVSLGLLLSSPSMLYALDSNNTDEGSASNVAIASVESAIDAQRDSTFVVEPVPATVYMSPRRNSDRSVGQAPTPKTSPFFG